MSSSYDILWKVIDLLFLNVEKWFCMEENKSVEFEKSEWTLRCSSSFPGFVFRSFFNPRLGTEF